jgi:hypothetical protein
MYNSSSEMSGYAYTRNYGKPVADAATKKRNLEYLKATLPACSNPEVYLDPGGNVSRNCLGQLHPDINKLLDKR